MVFYFFSWVHLHLVDDTRNQTLQETENKPRSTKGSVPHCSNYRRDRRMGEREDGDRCSGVEAGERILGGGAVSVGSSHPQVVLGLFGFTPLNTLDL